MAWASLIIAGVFEMMGVSLINKFNQEKSWQSVIYLCISFGASFFFLNRAMADINIGTAYAVWTGIGAAGGAILGMVLYGEAKDKRRLFCLLLIIGSTIGLKFVS